MPKKELLSPEERESRRRASVRESVARHKAAMDKLTRAEQAAWKARGTVGEDFDPYTPEERKEADRIQRAISKLTADAAALSETLLGRLTNEAEAGNEASKAILEHLGKAQDRSYSLKPF